MASNSGERPFAGRASSLDTARSMWETSELLFEVVRPTLTSLDRARPATPCDEGDADTQGESVDETHSSGLCERGLGWVIVAASWGRQR